MRMDGHTTDGCAESGIEGSLPGSFSCIVRRLVARGTRIDSGRSCCGRVVSAVVEVKQTRRFVTTVSRLVRHLIMSRLRVINSVCSEKPKPRLVVSGLLGCRSISVR